LVPGSSEVIGASIHGKNGNQRGTTEDIYAVVVPDKDISKCSLVHLSRYMALTEKTNQRVNGFSLVWVLKASHQLTVVATSR